MRVDFYYNSDVEPTKQYFCDRDKALELLKKLEGTGVTVNVTNMKEFEGSIFRTYNAAVTGPPSNIRGVFGTKGALEEDFGNAVPALLIFKDEKGRYPDEVYPRMDRDLGRLLAIEEALENMIG